MQRCFALTDGNAFYSSAELLFKPWLRDEGVVVASSNDGCVVSRNDTAKALGIKMGQPVFELKGLMERQQLHVFSSNYPLYQTISDRIMAIIAERSVDAYAYSIDESFSDLTGIPDTDAWAQETQSIIQQRVGMPVGIGIGPTKTLAKLANWAAKKWKRQTGCIVSIMDEDKRNKLLRYAPVEEVWGIGSRTTQKLKAIGIMTAWDLANADPKRLRKMLSVNVERTARELAGTVCFALHEDVGKKKMIACTRSFGSSLQVFARTSEFAEAGQRYARSVVVQTPYPTSDTRVLLASALSGLREVYREGYAYAKAGIVLMEFSDVGGLTQDLFTEGDDERSARLMAVMDKINGQMGRGTLKVGRDTGPRLWAMRQDYLSPGYMNDWRQLARVKLG